MIRSSVRSASACASLFAGMVLSLTAVSALAQTEVPAAPESPKPAAAPAFPKPNPENFTATAPSKETIDGFLHASWGYDENRIWQVQAILKTQVEGVSKVIVLVGEKSGKDQSQALEFFALPDGKHIIAGDQIVNFGAKPFEEFRALVQKEAVGPYRGAASKDLELVEFADYQCPHCKEAQANMDKLAADYPQARFVFGFDPIPTIHPQAMLAATYGYCVAKQAGSSAFFPFSAAVFEGQDGLATADGAQLTLNSALAKAGADAAKVAACAATPEAKSAVEASRKLAGELGINQVPMLVINGRTVPATAPYETLKKIIDFQIKLDGLAK